MILYNNKIQNVYNLLKILSRIKIYNNKILKRLGLKNKKYNKKKKNFNKKFHTWIKNTNLINQIIFNQT